MADPVVHLTNGLPDSGTGNITTLGQTLLDGANVTIGAKADAKSTATDTTAITAMSVWKQISASVQAAATSVAGTLTVASHAVTNAGTFSVQVSNANPDGQAAMASSAPVAVATDQKWQTGMSPRAFSVAFSTLTRPANTTAYTALDSISDNATAGSVTALTATVSDTNSDPLTITEILISSTDTGLAGKKIRAYLFNSDPTASSGVGGGDNAAYSQKKAGYIGSMSGVLETGFSDGTVGRLVPSYADGAASPLSNAGANGFIVSAPSAAGKALWIQYQAIDGFTPSANSTTIIGTIRGFQGRAS